MAGLSRDSGKRDVLEEFSKFGKINLVTLKEHFAFVNYETHEAAVQAQKEMNGKEFVNGEVLKVEQSRRSTSLDL